MGAFSNRQGIGVAVLTVVSLFLYSAISVLRWLHFDLDSYDLPVYHQIVWHLSRFEPPAVSVLGEATYFGDHFSPILQLFAPAYWVVPSPVALLIGQALLIASSIPALYLYARRRVTEPVALLLCLAYAQSWGIWAAVDSAVHEVAFAAPLLAWGVYFADTRRWPLAFGSIGALLFVKEDFGLVIAALGVVFALRGARPQGLAFVVIGVCGFILVNDVVMPALGSGEWSPRERILYGAYGNSPGEAAAHLVGHPGKLLSALGDDPQKPRLVALLLGAFVALPLLSPLSLVVVPQVLERLLANDPNLWGPNYQYSLVPMVILALAAADGLGVLERAERLPRRLPGVLAGSVAGMALIAAVNFPLGRLVHPGYWTRSGTEVAADDALRAVPDNATVAGDWATLSHLRPRPGMFLTRQPAAPAPRYLVLRSRDSDSPARRYTLLMRAGTTRVYRLESVPQSSDSS